MNGNLFKVFGFDGLECRDYPADIRSFAQKRKMFEFRGLGEVREMPPRCGYACEEQ